MVIETTPAVLRGLKQFGDHRERRPWRPFNRIVRRRRLAQVLSMEWFVRRRFLCSAGKPQNAGWVSRSLLRVGRLLAFGRGALDQLIERRLGSSHDLGRPASWSVQSR